jgi:dTDP-4-dehydrorhamnose 3,5-epimerase
VTVLRGCVLDVLVDVRAGSSTFGWHVAVELNEDNHRQVWIPRGLAHGFVVRSQSADFFYKCDELYSLAHELVVRWNDPQLGIAWGEAAPLVSKRDAEGRTLAQLDGLLLRRRAFVLHDRHGGRGVRHAHRPSSSQEGVASFPP